MELQSELLALEDAGEEHEVSEVDILIGGRRGGSNLNGKEIKLGRGKQLKRLVEKPER